MKIRKIFLFVHFGILCISISNSQSSVSNDTIYIDEFNKLSEKDLTLKKCKSDVFFCNVMKYDSLIAYHVKYKYRFGKLTSDEMDSLYSILQEQFGEAIDKERKTIINYRISVLGYKDYLNYIDSTSVHLQHRKMNKRMFNRSLERTMKFRMKCIRKINKKKESNIIYAYSNNYGRVLHDDFPWFNDRTQFLTRKFFNEKDIFHLLILNPDGWYFQRTYKATNADFSQEDIWDLLERQNWSAYIEQWEKRKKSLTKSRLQVYINSEPRYITCF